MTSFIVKEESETIRHFKLIKCTPFYLKPAEIEAIVIEKLICAKKMFKNLLKKPKLKKFRERLSL